jgi:hypothetical protein
VIDREAIYRALYSLVQKTTLNGAPAFVTVSRKPLTPDQLTPDMQPAIAMEEGDDEAVKVPFGAPRKWMLHVDLGLYYYFESQPNMPGEFDPAPSIELNRLLGAVEAALAPNPVSGLQTLGGLVQHCWIEGKVLKSPAYLQAQGAAIVPVVIMAV